MDVGTDLLQGASHRFIIGILRTTRADGNRWDAVIVNDDDSAPLHRMDVTHRFQFLKSEEIVSLSLADKG